MSQPPYGQVPPGVPGPPVPPPWPPAAVPPAAARGNSRALGILGVVLGLTGLIAGVSAWLRPAPKPEAATPVYSAQEVADAKKSVCEAYDLMRQAMIASSNRDGGGDPTATLAVAVNVRLALYAGSDYLFKQLKANPATPQELRLPVEDFASTYEKVALKQLADVPRPELEPFGTQAKADAKQIEAACK